MIVKNHSIDKKIRKNYWGIYYENQIKLQLKTNNWLIFSETDENLKDISLGKPTVCDSMRKILGSNNFITDKVH